MSSRKSTQRKRAIQDFESRRLMTEGIHNGTPLRDVPAEYLRRLIYAAPKNSAKYRQYSGEMARREREHEKLCFEAESTAKRQLPVNTPMSSNNPTSKRRETIYTGNAVDLGDGVPGAVSPWGIRYPEDWHVMTKGERKAWKERASVVFAQSSLSMKKPMTMSEYRKSRKEER